MQVFRNVISTLSHPKIACLYTIKRIIATRIVYSSTYIKNFFAILLFLKSVNVSKSADFQYRIS